MAEVVRYEGEFGLIALVQALDNVRKLLDTSQIEPAQAAGYLGCINLHLAQSLGVGGEIQQQLRECAGLICPACKGYVGFVSDLSSACPHCGERFFPLAGDRH